MTFDRMEELLDKLIYLRIAFDKYNMSAEYDIATKLMKRLGLHYDDDNMIEEECYTLINNHQELMNKFYYYL